MLLDAGRAFAATRVAPPREGPAWVQTPDTPMATDVASELVVDYELAETIIPVPVEGHSGLGLALEGGWEARGKDWAVSKLANKFEVDPVEGIATVHWAIGGWEIDAISLFEDRPFPMPPMTSETDAPDDTLNEAMPIPPAGPIAISGTLGPSDPVDYFKIDGTEPLYQLAFGNAQPNAKGGHRIYLIDQHGQTLRSLIMPAGKGVLMLDLRQIQPPGEPLYIGIARDPESANPQGLAETETYWVFVQPMGRSGGEAGSSWYDFTPEVSTKGGDRGQGDSESHTDAAPSPVTITVAASEAVIADATNGLPTGPLPRLAAGWNRGLLGTSFTLGRVLPGEGPALDLPAQVFDGIAGDADEGNEGNRDLVVALGGARFPLLAAASLSTPEPPPMPAEPGAGGQPGVDVVPELVETEVEAKPSRRLPAGLGLATVLAVSLMLPDFAATRPGAFLRRRLALGNGGERRGTT